MEVKNRYFIVDYPVDQNIINICVEESNSVRINNDYTKCVVKLPVGDTNNYPALLSYTEYTHDEILNALNTSNWISDLQIDE